MTQVDLPAVLARTRTYIQETFLYMRPAFVLGDDDGLLEKGVIDSMGVLELIGFLQTQFAIVIRDEDVTEENFGTLADIARYVVARDGNGTGR